MQVRDADGVGTTSGYRIVNRFLHGNVVDQLLSDEQYASGNGPEFSRTTTSTTPGRATRYGQSRTIRREKCGRIRD